MTAVRPMTVEAPAGSIRVMVVSDTDDYMREGLAAVIERAPDLRVVALLAGTEDILGQMCTSSPDVAVVHASHTDEDILEAARALRSQPDPVEVVLAATFRARADSVEAEEAGVRGFVERRSAPKTLHRAVRTVAAGDRFFDPDIPEQCPHGLTEQQRQILELLPRGLTIPQIGDRLHVTEKHRQVPPARDLRRSRREQPWVASQCGTLLTTPLPQPTESAEEPQKSHLTVTKRPSRTV